MNTSKDAVESGERLGCKSLWHKQDPGTPFKLIQIPNKHLWSFIVSSTHLLVNVKQYLRGTTRQSITTCPVDLDVL